MIRAKNCETVFKFFKVMPKILVASFFLGHGVFTEKCALPIAQTCFSSRMWALDRYLCAH